MSGYSLDASLIINPTTLFFYELDAIMKIMVIKDVLPPYVSINHIRTFEEMCKYILFPFMQLFIPSSGSNYDD